MWPDLINGGFELVGAYFTWRNFQELRQARQLRGVYWPTTAFFSAWGIWNLVYYPTLGQWASFIGGVALVAGNVAWVVLAVRLQVDRDIEEVLGDGLAKRIEGKEQADNGTHHGQEDDIERARRLV